MKKLPLLTLLLSTLALDSSADTTLTYESVAESGDRLLQTFDIHGRWVRISSEKEGGERQYLLDTGYMIMYVIDHKNHSYATFGRLSLDRGYRKGPSAGNERLRTLQQRTSLLATLDTDEVAGYECHRIHEMKDDTEVSRHCMADAKSLNITPKELRSMARMFAFNRDTALLNLNAGHFDERVISISSEASDRRSSFRLKSISTQPISAETFQIPLGYQKVEPTSFLSDIALDYHQ